MNQDRTRGGAGGRTPRPVGPRGVFRAVETRDGAARDRDGETFVDSRELGSRTAGLWEIRFADGTWMIASSGDLEFD